MDADARVGLARTLAFARSRRGAIGGLLAGGLNACLGATNGADEAAAKKHKKHKKKCKGNTKLCGKTCIDRSLCCAGTTACSDLSASVLCGVYQEIDDPRRCTCWLATSGETRCGYGNGTCGCTVDADCSNYGPGSFCAREEQYCEHLCGDPGANFCVTKCPYA
jgi:hypothetical protein